MGRHQVNPNRKYFTFEPASNKSLCQIVGCGAKIAGNHGGNLQRHIEKKHPGTFREIQRQHGLKRPAGDGGQAALHLIEEGEGEEEAYEYDSPASAANIFSNYRPITPPDITEQAISFRLKGENDDDLISNEPSSPPRALKQDLVLKQFTDIMLADMRQIQDPLLLMKLRRDVTDLVFKAVEEDAKRSQIENRKELYCQQMLPRMQMSSEPCSSGGSGPSTYMKNSRKQRRANRSQRLPTGGGGGGGGGAGAGGAGAAGEEWRESMCELNSSVAQVKTETESLEEMDIPGFFPAINLEGNHEG